MDQLRLFFSAQSFLGQTVLLLLFAAYFPTFGAWFVSRYKSPSGAVREIEYQI